MFSSREKGVPDLKTIIPPEYVRRVLEELESHSAQAYLVGGCVRDSIMGRKPGDWDICTDAAPERIQEIFPKSRPTGLRHGTVTVISGGRGIEVTTFRSDGEYKDHRRPDSVTFIADLRGDLSRRDFAMNAIAWSMNGGLVDPFGGIGDINAKTIRCVGKPDERFNEDALRMLRAYRFSAVLDFIIEPETLESIKRNATLTKHLAAERVRVELEKTLLSDRPEVLGEMLTVFDFQGISRASKSIELGRIKTLPKDPAQRWTALCSLLCAQGILEDTALFLSSLKLDSETQRSANEGSRIALGGRAKNGLAWKKLLYAKGEKVCRCAAAAMDVLYSDGNARLLRKVLGSDECYSLKDLQIGGDELKQLGIEGRRLGEVLDMLMDYVLENPQENKREYLLELTERILERQK